MKRVRFFAVLALCAVCLLCFVGCATELVPPEGLAARPQNTGATAPASDAPSADGIPPRNEPQADLPAYWKGNAATLPDALLPDTSSAEPPAESGTGTESGGDSPSASAPTSTEEPPHTTAKNPNPDGGGRGDGGYEVVYGGGTSDTAEFTPFY